VRAEVFDAMAGGEPVVRIVAATPTISVSRSTIARPSRAASLDSSRAFPARLRLHAPHPA
jgi:hypothetical protein